MEDASFDMWKFVTSPSDGDAKYVWHVPQRRQAVAGGTKQIMLQPGHCTLMFMPMSRAMKLVLSRRSVEIFSSVERIVASHWTQRWFSPSFKNPQRAQKICDGAALVTIE